MGDKRDIYLDKWYEVCLSCSLENCFRDEIRDDHIRKQLIAGQKLCPIVIAKKMKWTPERILSELK